MTKHLPDIPWLHSLRVSPDGYTALLTEETQASAVLLSVDLRTLQITAAPEPEKTPDPVPVCRVFDTLEQFRSAYGLHTRFRHTVPGQTVTEALTCPAGILFLSMDEQGQHLCLQTPDGIHVLKTAAYPMPHAAECSAIARLWTAQAGAPLLVWLSGEEAGDSCPLFRFWVGQMPGLGCHVLWLPAAASVEQAEAAIGDAAEKLNPAAIALFGVHQGASLAYSLMAGGRDYAAVIAMDGIANLVGRMGIHPETPEQSAEALWKSSALSKAAAFRTPTLLFSNSADHVFGFYETQQIFQALIDRSVPAKMIRFHEDGPLLTSKENWSCFLLEASAWLRQYLFAGGEG